MALRDEAPPELEDERLLYPADDGVPMEDRATGLLGDDGVFRVPMKKTPRTARPSAPPAPVPLPGTPSSVPLERLVLIGKILKPHGIRGEVRTLVLTDFPGRFEETERVYLFREADPGPARLVEVEGARFHHGRVLLKLAGVDTVEGAQQLRGCNLAVHEDELSELEEDEYWHFQLEGLEVVDTGGGFLGRLESVVSNPAHDLYVVRTAQGELLIPAVSQYVLDIDLEAGVMRVSPPVFSE